jgi:hypothetical protein
MNTHDGYFFRKCSSKLGNIVSKSFFNVSTICVFIISLLIKSSSNLKEKKTTRNEKVHSLIFYHHEKNKIWSLN